MRTMGAEIRAAREGAKMSIRELARRTDISAPYLCDIELDRRVPGKPVLDLIADTLKLDAGDMFARSGRLTDAQVSYIRSHPTAGRLMRRIAAADLPDVMLEGLMVMVDALVMASQPKPPRAMRPVGVPPGEAP